MTVTNIVKHYQRMKKILGIIERGEWGKYPAIARMSIAQIENMKKTIEEFEALGIQNIKN